MKSTKLLFGNTDNRITAIVIFLVLDWNGQFYNLPYVILILSYTTTLPSCLALTLLAHRH